MRHVLPPLPSLTAFEAAARHGSFTRAAEELNMSQSAVSKRIASLEDWLDIRLFERIRQRIVLTEAGEHFLARVRAALEIMDEATVETLSMRPHVTTLNLATLTSFGHYWLSPRLGQFAATHPHITLNVTTRKWPFDFKQENTDAAILYSPAPWAGGTSVRLFGEEMITVCAPGAITPEDTAALARMPLLHHRARHHDWQNWLTAGGIAGVNAFRGSRFEQFDMIIRCAAGGHGIGLVPSFMAVEDLAAGKIVQPFLRGMTSQQGYYLAHPPAKQGHPALIAFKKWLFEQIPQTDRVVDPYIPHSETE